MNSAWSVIFLTTLSGAGQGLFMATFAAELAGYAGRGGAGWGFFAQANHPQNLYYQTVS